MSDDLLRGLIEGEFQRWKEDGGQVESPAVAALFLIQGNGVTITPLLKPKSAGLS